MKRSVALVDTNVVSYMFRGDTRADLYDAILNRFDHIGISFQTLAEVEFWTHKRGWDRRRQADFALFLSDFFVVYPDEETCLSWASIRFARQRAGRPLLPEDAWIAATALTLNCPLITHDAGDFAGIDGLEVLTAT